MDELRKLAKDKVFLKEYFRKTFTEEQRQIVYLIVGLALEEAEQTNRREMTPTEIDNLLYFRLIDE